MNDRQPAEELCALAMTSALGNLNLRANSARDTATVPGWVNWLARAAARERGLPNAKADRAYLTKVRDTVDILIGDQIVCYRANAHRMHRIESHLHFAGKALFGGTTVACALWIAPKRANVPMNFGGGSGLTEITTWLTAARPALGAAMYGIGMPGDFAGLAPRSEATVTQLERLMRALRDNPLEFVRLNVRLRRLADIMIVHIAHWRTTYQARPLKLPG